MVVIVKPKRFAELTRRQEGDSGTFGELVTDTGLIFLTGELPWRDLNGDGFGDPQLSRFNPGNFVCRWAVSKRFGTPRYHVLDVPGRSGILIHGGNFVGDKTKRFTYEGTPRTYLCSAEGCIVLGRFKSQHFGQTCLTHSQAALRAFETEMRHEDFELRVYDDFAD